MPGLPRRFRRRGPALLFIDRWRIAERNEINKLDQSILRAHQDPLGTCCASSGRSLSLAHSSAVQTRMVAGNPLINQRAELVTFSVGRWSFKAVRFEEVFVELCVARTASVMTTSMMPAISPSSVDGSIDFRSFGSGKPKSRTDSALKQVGDHSFGYYGTFPTRVARRRRQGRVDDTSMIKKPVGKIPHEGLGSCDEADRSEAEDNQPNELSKTMLRGTG